MIEPDEAGRDLVPAALLRRLAAFLLDFALCVFLAAGVGAGLRALAATGVFSPLEDLLRSIPVWDDSYGQVTQNIVSSPWAIFFVYSIIWWAASGTSVGMWLTGLRIRASGGRRPGLFRSLVRALTMTLLALPLGFTWWTSLARGDRAALHDLISRTRVIRAEESGGRVVARGLIRGSVTHRRLAALALVLLLLGSAGAVVAIRALPPRVDEPAGAVAFAPLDLLTQEAIKGAILEYDRMEEHAVFRLDASILEPRATQTWLSKKSAEFADLRRRGLREESRLVDADFKAFRRVGDDRVEADVVETWVSVIGEATGRVLQERQTRPVPQTAILVNDRGRWKMADVRHYEPGANPF